jgi:YegS/Rv2252/BmrU family lipid kinase
MRKVLVLYNPSSGSRTERRKADVDLVVNILRKGGWEVTASVSGGTEKAAEQASQAPANSYDTVVACGGDGTIHDILQAVAGTRVLLGVIPLGTANTLAHDLKIPLNVARAAECLLTAVPRRFAAGRVEFQDFKGGRSSRFFTVAVGVGVDAHLFYKLNAAVKSSMGMAAYYAKATHLWFTHPMRFFEAELSGPDAQADKAAVSELLAVRITQFGGILRELAPGANLARNDLRLLLFRTSSRLRYLAYIIRGLLRMKWCVRGIELRSAERVSCRALPDDASATRRIYVEADGELVGSLPAEISIVPDAVTLLVPHDSRIP